MVKGVDRVVPVDVYVPGCPPTPESLMFGILKLHERVAEYQQTGPAEAAGPSPGLTCVRERPGPGMGRGAAERAAPAGRPRP